MPIKKRRRERRPLARKAYLLFFFLFAAPIFVSHLAFLSLPFFWDEVGQFIPAALDLYRSGSPVPYSATPNAHPPGVMAYLAAVWKVTGYSIVATRVAMLLLASACALVVFLLAIKLCGGVRGVPAFVVVAALICSPLFYAQALLAQLDMPAMLFTLLALLLFLEDRIALSACACAVLVLVKETGLIAPLLFGGWLLFERRAWQAAFFLLPIAVLVPWFLLLQYQTGHIFGNTEFAQYNLTYLAHPVRMAFALGKRLYSLFWENLQWIGTIGIAYALAVTGVNGTGVNGGGVYVGRSWRLAWALVAAQVAMLGILGGAMLERYLLPVLPVVYIGMVAGLAALPAPWRGLSQAALIAGLAVSNFWNPPYPFPFEDNLAFTDFVKLHQIAAEFLEQKYSQAEISTAWPLSAALRRPEFGYVKNAHRVREIRDFGESSMAALGNAPVDVFVLFSRQWDPPGGLMRSPIVTRIWSRYFSYSPQIPSSDLDREFHLRTVASWSARGQWVEVHAPSLPPD